VTVAADYAFKNVRFDFFGELKPSGNVWFGTADAGETAYFGMRWIGGTLNYAGSETLSFVCPKATGGRVVCKDGIYLKDAKYLPLYSYYYSFNVGYLNPQDEPFEMVIDGCYLDMRVNRSMYFGGAAAVKCVNGGGLYKHDAWRSWGLSGRIYVQDNATLELDGDAYVYYVYNQRHTVSFSPATANAEQLILKNGSYFAVHTPVGNSKAAVRVEDAYCDVMGLQVDANGTPQQSWYYDVFNGFSAINVPAGKFFCIRSSGVYNWGAEWDRELAIGAPIVGGGALVISNATALADVKAKLVRQYGSAAPEHFATARGYGMRAIVKLGTNTATGEAKAVPCEQNCQLVFADGSNWAGTLIADENVAFTNLTDAAAPASATFGTLKLTGKLPIRVWKNGQTTACDSFTVTGAVVNVAGGAITPVPQDDYEPQFNDSFALGLIPAAAELPAVKSDWELTEGAVVNGFRPLTLNYSPKGMTLLLR
ncbi:MAG: hypothetical protein PHI56_09590, partial [Victivallaceae bacterium]|nr:hypothetical protein [Victivallaceae bacterium]